MSCLPKKTKKEKRDQKRKTRETSSAPFVVRPAGSPWQGIEDIGAKKKLLGYCRMGESKIT